MNKTKLTLIFLLLFF